MAGTFRSSKVKLPLRGILESSSSMYTQAIGSLNSQVILTSAKVQISKNDTNLMPVSEQIGATHGYKYQAWNCCEIAFEPDHTDKRYIWYRWFENYDSKDWLTRFMSNPALCHQKTSNI